MKNSSFIIDDVIVTVNHPDNTEIQVDAKIDKKSMRYKWPLLSGGYGYEYEKPVTFRMYYQSTVKSNKTASNSKKRAKNQRKKKDR